MENITATAEVNERQVEMMVGKAMCAYANAVNFNKVNPDSKNVTACMSEYEATIRCLEMFVNENIYAIQRAIIARAEEEFGL